MQYKALSRGRGLGEGKSKPRKNACFYLLIQSARQLLLRCSTINRLKSSGIVFLISQQHTLFQADGKSSSPALFFL
jgi:hypothetical protein